MPDFSKLLRKPAGEAKKPEALPVGDYPGVIKSHEYGDNNKNKTPYVRLFVAFTGWPDGAEEIPEVDLSKRQMRRDYYLTEDALWRLDDLIRSCGIDAVGRSYEEVIPELLGQAVLVEVQQYTVQNSDEKGNQIGKIVGLGG